MKTKSIKCFGYASDIAGAYRGAALGPEKIKNSIYLTKIKQTQCEWHELISPPKTFSDKLSVVKSLSEKLGSAIAKCVFEKSFFTVIGGDHTSAIGTWSGASMLGDIGLIWIDAHMDSHTPDTSETGNLHGMPLACLLGKGPSELVNLLDKGQKIKPENLCLIGVRSYEKGEAALLEQSKVKIFYMEDVKKRGLSSVLHEATQIVTKNTVGFGLTIDVDSIDPLEASGTGVKEPDGLSGEALRQVLSKFSGDTRLLGLEIAEFDPTRDKDNKTEKLIANIISAVVLG